MDMFIGTSTKTLINHLGYGGGSSMTIKRNGMGTVKKVTNLCRLAHVLRKEGDLRGAEEKYSLVLEMDPGNVYALVGMGDLRRREKQFEEAVQYYQRSLVIEKKNRFSLAGLGDAYRGLGKIEKAIEVWSRCLSLDPDDYKVMTRLADGFRKTGDLNQAKRLYLSALKKNPFDTYAMMGLGIVFTKEGNDMEALKFFDALHELSEHPIIPLTAIANIYRRQRKYGKAIGYYEKALKIDSGNSHTWHGKADCLRGMRDYPGAIKAWRMAQKCGMNPRIVMTRIGDAYFNLDDLNKAEKSYNAALALGYDRYASMGMARIHAIRKQLDEVSRIFSELLKKTPNNPRIISEFKGLLEKYPQLERPLPM